MAKDSAVKERLFPLTFLWTSATAALVLVAMGIGVGLGLLVLCLILGLAVLRYSRRCPACGEGQLPRRASHGIYECGACGERFRRVRQGAATWLDRQQSTPIHASLRRPLWVHKLENIPRPPGERWSWISAVLPRLRALRRQLRPLADGPVRVLNLIKPTPVEMDLHAPVFRVESPVDQGPALTRSAAIRQTLAHAAVAVALSAAILASAPSLWRLRALDEVYFIIVVFAICTCALMTLVLGRVLELTGTATLGMLTTDLVLKALHLAALGHLPDVYVLGSMAVLFPTTPLIIAPLFRPWRVVEQPPTGQFTTGHLLRSKQARAELTRSPLIRQSGR